MVASLHLLVIIHIKNQSILHSKNDVAFFICNNLHEHISWTSKSTNEIWLSANICKVVVPSIILYFQLSPIRVLHTFDAFNSKYFIDNHLKSNLILSEHLVFGQLTDSKLS
jgi:hypothetical protein